MEKVERRAESGLVIIVCILLVRIERRRMNHIRSTVEYRPSFAAHGVLHAERHGMGEEPLP